MDHRIDVQPLSAASTERLDRLFRLYNNRLLSLAIGQTRDRHTAEDIVSETWIRVARCMTTIQADDDHALAFLGTVLRHTALDHYKSRRNTEFPVDFESREPRGVLAAAPSAEDVALTDAAVIASLAGLPESQRVALRLHCGGLTYKEIAARMGIERRTASRHVRTAVAALRSRFESPSAAAFALAG